MTNSAEPYVWAAFVILKSESGTEHIAMDIEQLVIVAQVAKELIAQHNKLARARGDD